MRIFRMFVCAYLLLLIISLFIINILFYNQGLKHTRHYMVEIERACYNISKGEEIEKKEFQYITNIDKTDNLSKKFLEGGSSDYVIREINGQYYRIDYISKNIINKLAIIEVNLIIILLWALLLGIIIYINKNILLPFVKIQNYSYELSKGNLTLPLKEVKGRYFGKFIWGLDLLREKLEMQKLQELKLLKEKKTLLLSLSHDVKTPLSAIKLYSKALSEKIYSEEAKQIEAAEKINEKADEIEAFIAQIIRASNEDFISLDVNNSEFYLSEIIDTIKNYYLDKLSINKIKFNIYEYSDCIVKGDADRAVEVLQNIIENAVKYGDGKFISVSFSKEEDCRLVTVSNSGCTLPENELVHIFDSFWRGSNSDGESGSGLGLYICRQLMNKMDGDIYAVVNDGIMNITAVFREAL